MSLTGAGCEGLCHSRPFLAFFLFFGIIPELGGGSVGVIGDAEGD
jgi:hypothetical protein